MLFARQPFEVHFSFSAGAKALPIRAGAWIGIYEIGETDIGAALRRGTFVALTQEQYAAGKVVWTPRTDERSDGGSALPLGDLADQHSGQGQLVDKAGRYELRFFSSAGCVRSRICAAWYSLALEDRGSCLLSRLTRARGSLPPAHPSRALLRTIDTL